MKKPVTEKQFDTALKNHSDATTQLKVLQQKKEAEIKKINEAYAAPIKEQEEKINTAADTIEAYCIANRVKVFGDKQSTSTICGLIGFQKGTGKLVQPDDMKPEEIIAALKKKDLLRFVSVKESIDATAVKKELSQSTKEASKLAALGFKIEVEEAFYIKPEKQ